MNSPTDNGSPESSSSGEEASPVTGGSSYISNFGSHVTTIGNLSGPSKRRLPQGSSFGATSSARDLKSRRRDRDRERERGEPGRPGWEKESGGIGKKEPKDDLLDQSLVEHLRKEIGDPFLEFGIKG